MKVQITLASNTGVDVGSFRLYSNTDGYVTAFETNVSRTALLAGYTSTNAPSNTTTVRVVSTGNCTTSIDLPVEPLVGLISLYNYNAVGANARLDGVSINGTPITLNPAYSWPIYPNSSAIATYSIPSGTSHTITVESSHGADSPIRVGLSTGQTYCDVSSGYQEFSGNNLSTRPSLSIALDVEGSGCS